MRALPGWPVPTSYRRIVVGTPLTIALATLASVALGAVAGCGSGDVDHEPVPTFSSATNPGPSDRPARETLLPTDCTDVLSAERMAALLGQPLDGVAVRTVIGQPAPSVGQLERVTCRYQRVPSGRQLDSRGVGQDWAGDVVIILTAYGTREQARNQHGTNVAAERSDARSAGNLSIGSAPAVLFDEATQTVLMVVSGRSAVSVAVQRGVVAPNDARAMLVDMAQRVLPTLAPEQPSAPAAPAARSR